jgi:hypothetical protein
MNADENVLDQLARWIIGSAVTVSNALGTGFLEKVYKLHLRLNFARPASRCCDSAVFP